MSDYIVISDDDNDDSSVLCNDSPQPGPSNASMQSVGEMRSALTISSNHLHNLAEEKLKRDTEIAIRESLLQSNGSESCSENTKRSKKGKGSRKTWCKTRYDKEKMRPITSKLLNLDHYNHNTSENSRSSELSDDDLPDLDDGECEIVSVQIYDSFEEGDSDCLIMDCDSNANYEQPVLSKLSEARTATNGSQTSAEAPSSEKSAFSVVKPSGDHSKVVDPCQLKSSLPASDKANRSPLFTEESKNKLANILRKTKSSLVTSSESPSKKGKLFGERVPDRPDGKVISKSNRHFMDMFENISADFTTRDSKEKFSTEDIIKFTTNSILEQNTIKYSRLVDPLSETENIPPNVDFPVIDNQDSDGVSGSRKQNTVILHEIDEDNSDNEDDLELVQIDKPCSETFLPTPVKKRKLDCDKGQQFTVDCEERDIYKIVNLKLGKPRSGDIHIGPPKSRTVRNKLNSVLLHESQFVKSSKYSAGDSSEILYSDWQKMLPFREEFNQDQQIEESLSTEMSQLHINTITACFEEEGAEFMGHAIKLLYDFSFKYQPTIGIVKEILRQGILDCNKTSLITQSYKTLMLIHQKYPGCIIIDWEVVKGQLDQLNLGKGHNNQDPVTLLKTSLLLRLTITVFEGELKHKDVSDLRKFRQSMAYTNLSYDSASGTNLKHLLNMIICCLTWGEFGEEVQEIVAHVNKQQSNDNDGTLQRQEVSKLLPLLQNLLHIAIEVSSSCYDCAKFCASELLKQFIYLGFSYKKLLLQTIKSSLLRFKLVSLVLDTYSENTVPCFEFPNNVCCIFECFFEAQPPSVPFTPPTTPQSDEEGEGGQGRLVPQFSQSSVEELAMLQYYVLTSYLQCAKYKTYHPLRRRLRMKKAELVGLSLQDCQELRNVKLHVEDLRQHLLSLTIDLTPNTDQYLFMMLCLQESIPTSC